MRRLRVLSEHPHLGRPNDVVREIPGAQAYVDAGFCEWADPPEVADAPVVVSRTQVVETTDAAGGAVETTSLAAADRARAGRAGTVGTARRRT
jgi:hypothetical protein